MIQAMEVKGLYGEIVKTVEDNKQQEHEKDVMKFRELLEEVVHIKSDDTEELDCLTLRLFKKRDVMLAHDIEVENSVNIKLVKESTPHKGVGSRDKDTMVSTYHLEGVSAYCKDCNYVDSYAVLETWEQFCEYALSMIDGSFDTGQWSQDHVCKKKEAV